jgi:hypothetical protein
MSARPGNKAHSHGDPCTSEHLKIEDCGIRLRCRPENGEEPRAGAEEQPRRDPRAIVNPVSNPIAHPNQKIGLNAN